MSQALAMVNKVMMILMSRFVIIYGLLSSRGYVAASRTDDPT
jgi:hypothetical protein